jgi:protein-S-isoprenylcysteine O-methyltransferase Ste14
MAAGGMVEIQGATVLLHERIRKQGEVLFRYRSFVPLLLLPILLLAFPESERLDHELGEAFDHWLFYGCLALSYAGLAVRWLTVGFVPAGTSGRNTRSQRAHELNTTGAYSVVRNPLYVGNFIAMLGVVLYVKVWWLALIFVLAYALYIERVVATEESYLRGQFGTVYDEWAARTPAFFPRLSNWQRPAQKFSLRTVLRREYAGVLAVALAYLVAEFGLDVIVDGEPVAQWMETDYEWLAVTAAAFAIYVVLRTLKKHTNLLRVTGR